jgi:hypothetical protein
MENQTIHEQEQELQLRLERILNSQASWDSIERALNRLANQHPEARFTVAEDGTVAVHMQTRPSVAEAVQNLESQGNYLAVQIEIQPSLWKVVSLDREFEAVFSAAEMTKFAQLAQIQRVGKSNAGQYSRIKKGGIGENDRDF